MRRSWKAFVLGAGVVLAMAIPAVVYAGFTSSTIDRQRAAWQFEALTTSSTTYQDVPSLSGIFFCSPPTVLSVSVNPRLTGGSAEFRVLVDGEKMAGGPARFDPEGKSRSFSYTFSRSIPNDNHAVDVQWRSRNGDAVTLQFASANLIYDNTDCV